MKNLVNSLLFHLIIFLPSTIWKTLLQTGYFKRTSHILFCCTLGLSYLLSQHCFTAERLLHFSSLIPSFCLRRMSSLLSHNSCIMCKSYISALLTFLLSWLFFSNNCVSYTFLAPCIWALRILEVLGIYGQSFLTGNSRPGLQPFQQPCHTVSEPFLPSYPS